MLIEEWGEGGKGGGRKTGREMGWGWREMGREGDGKGREGDRKRKDIKEEGPRISPQLNHVPLPHFLSGLLQ